LPVGQVVRWEITCPDDIRVGTLLAPPSHYAAIFSTCGADWPDSSKTRVKQWLAEQRILRFILPFTASTLGKLGKLGQNRDAAEEVLNSFWTEKLDGVIDRYDPELKCFPRFLLDCLQYYCREFLRKNRRRLEQQLNLPLDTSAYTILDTRPSSDPELPVQYADFWREFLTHPDHNILWLKEIVGLTYQEIAVIVDLSETATKVRAFRAKQQLAKRLGGL
jgi:RNA polymerase sigma factor (sigma-70 family)